jgi:hypothetical protein
MLEIFPSAVTFHGRLKMTSRMLSICAVILAISISGEAVAQSFGHYHLPSTLPQFCGLGYGAGHHAPMIRPGKCCEPLRIERYVHVPGCGAFGAMPMQGFAGCSSPGCHAQLDQILQGGNDDGFNEPTLSPSPVFSDSEPITPTEPDALGPGGNWSIPLTDPLPSPLP